MNEFNQCEFSKCPRCESKALETLATHSYCIECNYSPDFLEVDKFDIPAWALDELRETETNSVGATQNTKCGIAA